MTGTPVTPEDNTANGNDDPVRFNVPDNHAPVLHKEHTLPEASGSVPNIIKKISLTKQREDAAAFFSFLTSDNPMLTKVNEGNKIFTAIVNIPRTSMVKLVYCMGVGSSPIGETSPIDGKLLFLQGDGNSILGPPQPVCLPVSMVEQNTISVMTEDQFLAALTTKGENYSYPLLPRNQINTDEELMQIAPIPAYFIYDGFEKSLDAAMIYERLLCHCTTDNALFSNLKNFLRACLSGCNVGDEKPYIDAETLAAAPSTEARLWAKEKFNMCFPSLCAIDVENTPQKDTNTDLSALIRELLAQRDSPRSIADLTSELTTEIQDDTTKNNMSQAELRDTLIMCGEASTGDITSLPRWVQDVAAKGTTDAYKHTIIRKWIMNTTFYEDAEVPLTAPLLKMIQKRAWIGKEGNVTRPSLAHAMEGLSPFFMLDLSEEEVASINDEADLLNRASLVSIQDLRKFNTKMKVYIPTQADEFMLILKRFANLLFALFSARCPLFKCMKEVIRALRDYSREARKKMSMRTKGSILWIILLQARQFGMGEINILYEFTSMHEDLRAKRMNINHSELPADLIKTTPPEDSSKLTGKRKNEGTSEDSDSEKESNKRQRKPNPNSWSPRLKAALEGPLKEAGFPTFTQVLKFCKTDSYGIYPKSSPICAPNAFLGRCYYGDKCTRKHTLPTNAEATEILKLLDPFIKDPKLLKSGP